MVGQQPEPRWISLREFIAALNGACSPWLIGELIRRNQLAHVRLGRKILVRADALDVLAAEQQDEAASRKVVATDAFDTDVDGVPSVPRPPPGGDSKSDRAVLGRIRMTTGELGA